MRTLRDGFGLCGLTLWLLLTGNACASQAEEAETERPAAAERPMPEALPAAERRAGSASAEGRPEAPEAESGERRERFLDAERITRTLELTEVGGHLAVPVADWLNSDDLPRFDPETDTLDFRVRGRAAFADPAGNLRFREEGTYEVEVIVRDAEDAVRLRHVVTGFENTFDGERRARISYRVPGGDGMEEIAEFTLAYEGEGPFPNLPRSAWLDLDKLDPESERDWLRQEDFRDLNVRVIDTPRGETSPDGTLRYRDDGTVRITARQPGGTLFDSVSILIENVTEGARSATLTRYQPDPWDVSEHILVVYNRDSEDSVALKDYYIRERPGFETVNVLGVRTDSGELIGDDEYRREIQSPVVNWLRDSGKNIRCIVLMIDIPTRVHDRVPADDGTGSRLRVGDSLSHRLAHAFRDEGIRDGHTYFDPSYKPSPSTHLGTPFSLAQFQGMTALVTHLNMGGLEASKAYIDKLKRFERTGPLLHPADENYASHFFLEDHNAHNRLPSNFFGHRYVERMAAGFARHHEMNLIHHPKGSDHVESGDSVAFFGTLGRWGGRGADYAVDGRIRWGADSDWWLMLSVESFNGQREPSRRQGGEEFVFYGPMNQGNYLDWFSADAFGGTDYSRTPVGAVCHVEEPTTGGINDWSYIAMWHDGFTFAECAWVSRRTGRFMAIGDPLVTRKPPGSP